MRLSIKDRFTMRSLWPEKTNWLNQVIMQGIQKKVDFDSDELDKLKKDDIIKELSPCPACGRGGGMVDINDEKEGQGKEVTFHDSDFEFIQKQIERIDKASGFTPPMFETIKKLKGAIEKNDAKETKK